MSLSASTLALFILLVPGLIFRFSVYEGSQVKRPFFAGGTIYSSIAVLLYSVLIFLIFIAVTRLLIFGLNLVHSYEIPLGIAEFNGQLYIFDHHQWLAPNRRYEIINFLVSWPKTSIICFLAICAIAYVTALGVQWLSRRFMPIGRMMYGPLAPLLSTTRTPVLTCFVLTKVSDTNRRLIYAGYPREISLKEGNNIDHIVLQNPEKFYLLLSRDNPRTSFLRSRPISSQGFSQSFMFVSGSEIENVHFEGFYFAP